MNLTRISTLHGSTRFLGSLVLAALPSTAAAQTIYETDFTTSDGWDTYINIFNCGFVADATPANGCAAPFRSAPSSLNYNNGLTVDECGGGGSAGSPIIDLSVASSTTVTLSIWAYFDAADPGYDFAKVFVFSEATGAALLREEFLGPQCQWAEHVYDLDPAWGEVRVWLQLSTSGFDIHPGAGLFFDDLRIAGADPSYEINCVGDSSAQTGGRVYLLPHGSQTASDNSFALAGAVFPSSSFAQAFYGASPGVIQYSSGTRCIAAPNSYRLQPMPTGAFGRPFWSIDLPTPATFSTPILAGSTWYFQAIYRDGPEFRFSDSITVTFE